MAARARDLGAVKRAVDDDPRPGRFILTGSSQTDLTTTDWPATRRIGLLGPLLRLDQRRVLRDGGLLGRVLDTFVAAQMRAECAASVVGADLFHYRDANGRHEVDLLIEA